MANSDADSAEQQSQEDNARTGEGHELAVSVRNVTFKRGDRVILENVSVDVRQGDVVGIMGPSGVGKTTLLKLITGQIQPDQGNVEVDGLCISSMRTRALYRFRRRIGVLLQNGALFTDLTVFENVAFPIREHTDLPEPLIRRLVLAKLEAVGLRGTIDLMPSELSGGMARRVALARAIVLDPSLILYDEPMSGLDPISLGATGRLIRQLNGTLGLTSVIVTHNVDEMRELADYCYIIADRRVVAQGKPDELINDASELVQQFLHGQSDGPVPFHYPAPDLRQSMLEAYGE